MKVFTQFDDELLARYAKRGSPPMFTIAWEVNGVCYPSRDWIDNGTVVLGWWLVVARRMATGEDTGKFAFMEGPYSLDAKLSRERGAVELVPEGLDVTWAVSFSDLVKELIAAAEMVCRKIAPFKGTEKERASLEKGGADLRAAVSHPAG
jgi:hypothetical protein